jgi:hypothetical protein
MEKCSSLDLRRIWSYTRWMEVWVIPLGRPLGTAEVLAKNKGPLE